MAAVFRIRRHRCGRSFRSAADAACKVRISAFHPWVIVQKEEIKKKDTNRREPLEEGKQG